MDKTKEAEARKQECEAIRFAELMLVNLQEGTFGKAWLCMRQVEAFLAGHGIKTLGSAEMADLLTAIDQERPTPSLADGRLFRAPAPPMITADGKGGAA
jgi:hypothetical protein